MEDRRILWAAAMAALAIGLSSRARADHIVDLTTVNSSGSANGAFFAWVDEQSTGTGVIKPFVRTEGNGITNGYNTGFTGPGQLQYETKAGTWTHAITLSQIPIVNGYFQFLLDINQTGADPLLSMHELVLYQSSNPNNQDFNLTTQTFNDDPGATKVFDLDAGPDGDSRVEMNYKLNPGSGAGDVVMYVPVSLFNLTGPQQNLYLYNSFGNPNADNDGFEEWAVTSNPSSLPPPTPGPAVVPLPAGAWAGTCLLGLLGVTKWRRVHAQ